MRTLAALASLFVGGTALGADKPIDPAVALAWATPVPAPTTPDRFTATDGVTYERHPDGVYRRAAVQPSVPAVAPGPFRMDTPAASGCGCTASANCGASFCKGRGGTGCPASCPVKSAQTAPPTILLTPVNSPGIGGCAGGNCPAPARGGLFRR